MKNALELLEQSNLNWNINKQPLFIQGPNEDFIDTNGFFGAVRSDNNDCLGTFTDRYEVFQNSEMMELALRVSEATGYKFNSGKQIDNGRHVQIKLNGGHEILEYPKVGDIIEKKVEFRNSHDGSGSLKIAMGTVVLSCTNGMTRFVKDQQANIRHTTNMREMVEEALRTMELVEVGYKTMMDEIRRMIETPLEADHIAGLFDRVMGMQLEKISNNWESEDYSTRALNKAQSLKDSIYSEVLEKGSNVWGLLSGVTHYTTHKAGTTARREKAKAVGSLLHVDNKAYDYALELI